MTKEQVALKLALEALEKSHICPLLPDDCAEAITAIKEALEQPENCEYCDGTGDVHSIDGEWRGVCVCEAGKALAQPEQEQLMSDQINYGMSVTQGGKRIDPMSIYKEPEQEPVAWVYDPITGSITPPQRKPLTDEEIESLYESTESVNWGRSFARAIEAAHGIYAPTELKGEA